MNSNYEKSEGGVKVIMFHFLWGLLILFCTMLKKVAICVFLISHSTFFLKIKFHWAELKQGSGGGGIDNTFKKVSL